MLPDGISVEIIDFGSQLRLSNSSDEVVSVPGYSGEPYLEVGPEGVRRNENSPTIYPKSRRPEPSLHQAPVGSPGCSSLDSR